MSFDGSSAVAIQKAQSIMKKPGIKNQLIYVRSNFKIICESITFNRFNQKLLKTYLPP
jgi:hypothetical protein